MPTYHVIGLLSGSSLDGIDIVWCAFDINDQQVFESWRLIKGETIPYSETWKTRLQSLPTASAKEFIQADADLGHLFGSVVKDFIYKHSIPKVDLVASHGHTIFHFPDTHVTTQIADGAAIVSECNIETVTQLRSMDLAYHGQGAPMAPLGDAYLLPVHDFYLNLGGIANVTYIKDHFKIAYDITTCNQILNALSAQLGLEYDDEGQIARSGICNQKLLQILVSDEYHQWSFPKSLDNTWSQTRHVKPFITFDDSIANKMNTAVEGMALLIAKDIRSHITENKTYTLTPTGGGALNTYLVERIKYHLPEVQIHLPSKDIIQFKEAAFMALAGLFRKLNIPNIYSSVTGATIDTINGAIYASQAESRI